MWRSKFRTGFTKGEIDMADTANPKVMAIVGSRNESSGMRAETIKATNKALDAGWRVSTGGAKGTDATAIKAALNAGKSGKLDVYLPARIKDQPQAVRTLLEAAKREGANIVENATGRAKYDAKGNCTNYTELLKPRNTQVIKNSNAAVVVQNNQSRGTQDALQKALKEVIPIKKLSFADGILKTVSKFNLVGAALSTVSTFLEYKETQEYFRKTNDLIEKWKQGPPYYTPEDAEELKQRGIDAYQPYDQKDLTKADPYPTKKDVYRAPRSGGGSGGGNPYHDEEGHFCSEGDCVTFCG